MIGNFCTLIARRIRLLGYAPKSAIWFARFFFVSMLSVCAASGLLMHPTDEAYEGIIGFRKSPVGVRIGVVSPDFFRMRLN